MVFSINELANSFGLLLDIVGVVLLWKYGLPESLSREGHNYLVTRVVDEAEKAKAACYDFWSRIGLALLIAGFAFQILSNFL